HQFIQHLFPHQSLIDSFSLPRSPNKNPGSRISIMTMPRLPAAEQFYQAALVRLQGLLEPQRAALDRAATFCTEAIANEGLVHLFGCGHSRMLCEEMTPRQGCFVGWHTIVELALTYHNPIVGANGLRQSLHLEKTPGY